MRCLKRDIAREVYNTLRADLAGLTPQPPRQTNTILCGSPGFGISRKRPCLPRHLRGTGHLRLEPVLAKLPPAETSSVSEPPTAGRRAHRVMPKILFSVVTASRDAATVPGSRCPLRRQRHACGVGNCARIIRSQSAVRHEARWLIIRCALGVTGHRAPGPIGFQRAEDRLGHRLGTAPEHAQRSAVGAGGELGNRGAEARVSAGVVDEHADGALGLGDVRHRRYPRTSFL